MGRQGGGPPPAQTTPLHGRQVRRACLRSHLVSAGWEGWGAILAPHPRGQRDRRGAGSQAPNAERSKPGVVPGEKEQAMSSNQKCGPVRGVIATAVLVVMWLV